MGNEVATIHSRAVEVPQTAIQVKAQIDRIQEVMKAVMKEGTHYGKIPGTQKPTLYKAGSEVLLTTFHIAVEPEVDDLSTSDEIRYRVRAIGRHQATGIIMGVGIGEASSNEEKYKWRAAVCDEEFDEADPDHRRVKYGWRWGQATGEKLTTKTRQVRTNPADVANTILKMAKKRAQIDLTLTALAASDIFTQDAEDLPEGMAHVADDARPSKPRTSKPRGKDDAPRTATEAQQKLIGVKMDEAGIPENAFLEHFQVATIAELPFERVNEALQFIKDNAP